MTATDELREYVINADGMGMTHGHAKSIYAIADRIDAEHEADVSTACRLAAGLDNDALAKRGYIKLPVDADGVPIHIGDYLHCDETGRDFPCRGYCCSVVKNGERRWTVECSYDAYSGTSEYASARRCRHRHAPTVEDVLREFFSRYVTTKETKAEDDAILAEYAAKLRLAGEE